MKLWQVKSKNTGIIPVIFHSFLPLAYAIIPHFKTLKYDAEPSILHYPSVNIFSFFSLSILPKCMVTRFVKICMDIG